MSNKKGVDIAFSAAKFLVNPTGFLLENMVKTAEIAYEATAEAKAERDLDPLVLEARKQDLMRQVAEAQAKVAQENAIAHRIDTAEEVEMEEYYEYVGGGKAGANLTEASISLGGEVRRVSKRIYRFKGKEEKCRMK